VRLPGRAASVRLLAGLLTRIHPRDAPSRLASVANASPVLLTALGTWRTCTAFPILRPALPGGTRRLPPGTCRATAMVPQLPVFFIRGGAGTSDHRAADDARVLARQARRLARRRHRQSATLARGVCLTSILDAPADRIIAASGEASAQGRRWASHSIDSGAASRGAAWLLHAAASATVLTLLRKLVIGRLRPASAASAAAGRVTTGWLPGDSCCYPKQSDTEVVGSIVVPSWEKMGILAATVVIRAFLGLVLAHEHAMASSGAAGRHGATEASAQHGR